MRKYNFTTQEERRQQYVALPESKDRDVAENQGRLYGLKSAARGSFLRSLVDSPIVIGDAR